MRDALYLIDGYGLIYRSYFAFLKNPLFNLEGENTSAVFGFFRSFFQLLKLRDPHYLAVIMDSKTPTFRHERFPEYKANREKAPEDLHAQIPVVEEILGAMGVAVLRKEGFEADDIIATLASMCTRESRGCYILSNDKDILQIVGGDVYVLKYDKLTWSYQEVGREEVVESRGIHPEQVIDYLALAGDQSDNLPGVKGVGIKTAQKLLADYRNIDEIYNNLAAVKPEGLRKKLAAAKENAYLTYDLATLRNTLSLDHTIEQMALQSLNTEAAIPLFINQGMKSLAEELGGNIVVKQEVPDHTPPGSYETVLDEPALERWLKRVGEKGVFAFDTETDSLDEMKARPIGFSLAVGPGEACYIPISSFQSGVLAEELVRGRLKELLENTNLKIIGQNIKYDYKVLKRWGIELENIHFDTMIASWLLYSNLRSFSLDSLALKFLNYQTIRYEEVVGKDKSATLAEVDIIRATDYAAEDADITFRLFEIFQSKIEEEGLQELFYNLEMPLVKILANMELQGIRLDMDNLFNFSRELEAELSHYQEDIFALCGNSFNLNSTKQLQEVLFNQRKLKPLKKTKTGFSTDKTVLAELALEDPVPEKVLNYRLLAKLKSTYTDSLPALVNTGTERLHTHFLQTGTATGRLSSRDPNLQNIPVRGEKGRRIRAAFVPDRGYSFLSADYSQIELVVLAALSGDSMLIEAFKQGRDVHLRTAAVIFGIEEEDVAPGQRQIGKTINFGVIYGMSAFRLARDLKISRSEARVFITRYFEQYAGVDSFIKEIIAGAEAKGYVETIRRRRRTLPGITSRNKTEKAAAERMAINSVIQGSAADIVKQAMIDVSKELDKKEYRTRLLLQVHDELIFEVPDDELEIIPELVKRAMESGADLGIPLRVQVEIGQSWGEFH